MVEDARSYSGSHINTDHRIVKANINIGNKILIHKKKKALETQYDVSTLTKSNELRRKYTEKVSEKIIEANFSSQKHDPNEKLEGIKAILKDAAKEILPCKKKKSKPHTDNERQEKIE